MNINEMLAKLMGSEPKDPISNTSSPSQQKLQVKGTEKKVSDKATSRVLASKQYQYPSKKQY